jgi:hypothetical protein
MAVTAFGDFPLADRDREWDGAAAEKRVRKWAGAEDEPNAEYRDAHVWYDAELPAVVRPGAPVILTGRGTAPDGASRREETT